jgi:translation initiation factor 2 subunit 1
MEDRYPERGELVICTVERVVGYGAFVRLDEYDKKQGMVSIKEFSRKWVKNPRDYLKEGQKAVLKVLRVKPDRGHIDLSLKAVNDNERRNRLKEYKLNIRINKLMEHFANQFGKSTEDLYGLFGNKLVEDYGSIYDAFTTVANGEEDLEKYIPDEKLRKDVVQGIRDSIKPTLVSIRGFVSIHSDSNNGLELLKEALAKGREGFSEKAKGAISYIAPPNYQIEITANDYKLAEKAMKKSYDAIEAFAKSNDMESEFHRELKKAET